MNFNQLNKQEKFSIRKYKSVGAASAMIGALFFLSSGSIVSAHESTSSNEAIVQPKNLETVSETPMSETDVKSSETNKTSSSKQEQPIDALRTADLRASDKSATDTSSITDESEKKRSIQMKNN